ncbi:MAG: hypothetical protein C0397_02225 [Odoribacter sp.]|nr:hypothetical protein [Odoribacter sp.]
MSYYRESLHIKLLPFPKNPKLIHVKNFAHKSTIIPCSLFQKRNNKKNLYQIFRMQVFLSE